MPVTWEGPAIYRTEIEVGEPGTWLRFSRASYEARVSVNGNLVLVHRGIWDAFAVPLPVGRCQVEVAVTKNGGDKFPVRDVLSGFLPYVFQTFGGICGPVDLFEGADNPCLPKPRPAQSRITIDGQRLLLDGQPFWMRGVLTWGWYPEIAHPWPDNETIRREVTTAKALGFNTIKFCLWLPPHEFLEEIARAGLAAWIELPLWAPSQAMVEDPETEAELRRIVLQYRHHECVVAWTLGCELGRETSPAFRDRMVKMISEETGCPLVCDNSGGAEMYGGDLREWGTFHDFHPYCEANWFGPVLESLAPRPRSPRPTLLGETCDYDHHRDLRAMAEDRPFWASSDPVLNHRGVRWQYDLPNVLEGWAAQVDPERQAAWRRFSISKGAFIRRRFLEAARSREWLSGVVLTGCCDTPISTSGFVDDRGEPVYGPQHLDAVMAEEALFLVPSRRPPWVQGGNRPGWRDTQCFFTGEVAIEVGGQSVRGGVAEASWTIEGVTGGTFGISHLEPCRPEILGRIDLDLPAGLYRLSVRWGGSETVWPIRVFDRLEKSERHLEGEPEWFRGWRLPHDVPLVVGRLAAETLLSSGRSGIAVIDETDPDIWRGPFWRECFFDYADPSQLPFANRWEWLYGLTTDCFLPFDDREGGHHMTRIDTRTYSRHSVIQELRRGSARVLLTTLRPQGGLGAAPPTFADNPAGHGFLLALAKLIGPDGS